MSETARPVSRIEAIVIGMGVGLLLLAVNRVVGITIIPNSQGALLDIFFPMFMGAIVVTIYIFVKKSVFHQDTNTFSLMTFFEGFVFGALGAVFWWVVPLFFFILSQVWLAYAVMIGSVVVGTITEPLWGFTRIDYGSLIGGAIGGLLFCTGVGLFGLGTGRELLGKSPWENKRTLKVGGFIAAIIGIVYGIVFAYFWTNMAFID